MWLRLASPDGVRLVVPDSLGIHTPLHARDIMGHVIVRAVHDREDQEGFLAFPQSLYRNNRCWVPPVATHEAQLAGFATHPFYEQAESQAFLACRNGEICGRVLSIINHAYNGWHHQRHGFFGFFEAINDQETADALLDAARDWLARRNCSIIRGPVSPSMTYQCGLLIDGFDTTPGFLMPYNPAYYAHLIETYGFRRAQDLMSYVGSLQTLDRVKPKFEHISQLAVTRLGLRMRHFDMDRFAAEMVTFYDIYHRALGSTWGFAPVTDSEVQFAGRAYREITVPEFTAVAEVDGKAIGMVFGILDLNSLIKESDGTPARGELSQILREDRRPSRARIVCALVVPQYNLWGVGPAMLRFLIDPGIAWGIREVEFSWIAETNRLSRGSLERGGTQRDKTYRVYELPLSGS
jgi:hypothetical protein